MHSQTHPTTLAVLALALASGMGAAQAQTAAPDAGSLMQQIERGQQPNLPQVRRPSVAPQPEMKPTSGMVITVSRFRFAGNTLIDESRLQPAVAPWVGRPLDFSELQKAAAAVAAVYREAGWVVRAYLPKQEIENGVVTIQIVEAVLGSVLIEAPESLRLSPEVARRMVSAAQQPGQPLNAEAVDRALLLVDDLPGVTVQGNLKEGTNDGETDLLLNMEPEPFLSGDVGVDNTGSRSTGGNRVTASLYAGSPFRLGDQIGVNLIKSEGSEYLRGAWSLPVGNQGWRLGANYSGLRYDVVTPEFSSYKLRGRSSSAGVDASYPIVRSRMKNLYLRFAWDRKSYYNESLDAATSDYGINVASVGLSGNAFDSLGGGGATTGALTLSSGKVDLGGSPNQVSDAAGANTQGSYQIYRYALNRLQAITPDLTLFAAWSGQMASRNLDSGERFYLGGANGVRAYPASEAGGSEGDLINLELRYRLPANLSLTGFYDWGRVKVNHNNDFAGAAAKNSLELQGAGMSMAWASPFRANFRLTWAHRIGTNPNPTATGKDQDGTKDMNRFWFMATLPF